MISLFAFVGISMIYSNGFLYSNNWPPPPLLWHPNSQHQDLPNKTQFGGKSHHQHIFTRFVIFRFRFLFFICYEDWMRKQSITAELKQCGSDGVGRSNSLFEENHTIKKMSWHSWVIVWLKEFHCLKVKTLLRFYWDSKYHFVSIIDSNIKITVKIK